MLAKSPPIYKHAHAQARVHAHAHACNTRTHLLTLAVQLKGKLLMRLKCTEQRKTQWSSSSARGRKLSMPADPFSSFSKRSRVFFIWVVTVKLSNHFWNIVYVARNYLFLIMWDKEIGRGLGDYFTDNNLKQKGLNWFPCLHSEGSSNRELRNLSSQSRTTS